MNPLQAVILFSGAVLSLAILVIVVKKRGAAYCRPALFFLVCNLTGPAAVVLETGASPQLWKIGYFLLYFYISFLPSSWYLMTARWGLDYTEHTRLERRLPRVALVVSLGFFVYCVFANAVDIALVDSRWYLHLKSFYFAFSAFFALMATVGLYSLETCYRSSLGLARERIKRSFFPLVAYGMALLAMTAVAMLYRQVSDWMLCAVFLLAALVSLPLARHVILFDPAADGIMLTRKGIYSSLAVVLVGIFFLVIGAVGELLMKYNLDVGLFFTVATLIVLTVTFLTLIVSQGLLTRFRAVSGTAAPIPRRRVYAEEWKEFSEEVSITQNIDAIFERTGSLLLRLLKIKQVFFIIREPAPSENYTLYTGDGIDRGIPGRRLEHIAEWLYRFGHPVETVTLKEKAPAEAGELAALAPSLPAEVLVLVPFIARQQFLGFWGIGAHGSGRGLSSDEVGFIEAAASPVALTILAARMTDELVMSREIESFHRISSFVMHDLKNSVAMLSMLLQNAEKNISNPAFQEAALVTIAQAVDRQRKILFRLTEQKAGDKLGVEKADLGALVHATLDRIKVETVKSVTVACNIPQGVVVYVDPEKVGSVFDNLVMNALEAMPQGGALKIEIVPSDDRGLVAVSFSDSGIGMAPEFVFTRLFKPFSSTKPHGLGIGMYQSQEIIRAHQGRLEVTSRLGAGTTFTVHLPGGN